MELKKIYTSQAVPGMIVANDVYTFNNQLIISQNTRLTDRIITRLKFYSVYDIPIFINDEVELREKQPDAKEADSESYYESVRKTPEFKSFNSSFTTSVNDFKEVADEVVTKNADINESILYSQTKKVLDKSRNGFHVFDMLHSSRNDDDLTYVHSLNVALICNVMGVWLKLPEDDIRILTLCGLLHDIGKIEIPSNIISKPTKLNNMELITVRMHTIKGYQRLKDKNIDERIKNVALMHHENCDGSGYPNNLTGNQIEDFAKIVSIADVYDAMTSARVYRGPLCPFEVIEFYENEGYQKFDTHYLLTFLEGIVQTYLHNQVRLNNGMKGEIIMLNKLTPTKPVIQTKSGFIDLSKHSELSITELL